MSAFILKRTLPNGEERTQTCIGFQLEYSPLGTEVAAYGYTFTIVTQS